ncbi:hypothetical protein FACS189490_10770 [Clostridia bacterium]|nr:hypothetical protein FACS189490_10770 [Clostridia bacterium]
MTKAPLGKEAVGKNPTDRGKNGTKRSLLVEEHGLPLSIVVVGANEHDVTLLAKTLDAVVVPRPKVTRKKKQNLSLDAGYTGEEHKKSVEERGYILHIRSRGDEKKEIKTNPKFKARRWVVEVTHSC